MSQSYIHMFKVECCCKKCSFCCAYCCIGEWDHLVILVLLLTVSSWQNIGNYYHPYSNQRIMALGEWGKVCLLIAKSSAGMRSREHVVENCFPWRPVLVVEYSWKISHILECSVTHSSSCHTVIQYNVYRLPFLLYLYIDLNKGFVNNGWVLTFSRFLMYTFSFLANNLLSSFQSGFKRHKATIDALMPSLIEHCS